MAGGRLLAATGKQQCHERKGDVEVTAHFIATLEARRGGGTPNSILRLIAVGLRRLVLLLDFFWWHKEAGFVRIDPPTLHDQ